MRPNACSASRRASLRQNRRELLCISFQIMHRLPCSMAADALACKRLYRRELGYSRRRGLQTVRGSHSRGLGELTPADPFAQAFKLFVIPEMDNELAASPTVVRQGHTKPKRGTELLLQ